MTLEMKYGGFEFHGFVRDYGQPLDGFYIGVDGVEGWMDGVEMRTTAQASPDGVGDFVLPGELANRTISWSGLCFAQSEDALAEWGEGFAAIASDGDAHRLQGDELGRQRWAMAQRSGKPTFRAARRPTRNLRARYEISLNAPDPRKYASVDRALLAFTSGPIEVSVRGTYLSTPTFTVRAVTNMTAGYTLQVGADEFRVSAPLFAGQTHVIDMADELVMRAGVAVLGAKAGGEPLYIRPRTPTTVSLIPISGTGQFICSAPPTFV